MWFVRLFVRGNARSGEVPVWNVSGSVRLAMSGSAEDTDQRQETTQRPP